MWADIAPILSVVALILTLGTAAGVGVQRGRVGEVEKKLAEARQDADAARKTRDDERKERDLKDAQMAQARAEDHAKIAALEAEVAYLKSIATGEVHWEALGIQIEGLAKAFNTLATELRNHNKAASLHWKKELEVLEGQAKTLTALTAQLRRATE